MKFIVRQLVAPNARSFAITCGSAVMALTLSMACSSKPKGSEIAMNSPAEGLQNTDEALGAKIGFRRLNLASVAMRAVFDQGVKDVKKDVKKDLKEDVGQNVLGCPITMKQAEQSLNRLHAMIDRQSSGERDQYSVNPQAYAGQFNACAASCMCGAFATLLDGADLARPEDRKFHLAQLKKLRVKAKLQGPDATLACAREQSWFCKSELKATLESN